MGVTGIVITKAKKGKVQVLGSDLEVSTGDLVTKTGKRKYVKRDTSYWESRSKKGKGITREAVKT
jgi:hypothetical protein